MAFELSQDTRDAIQAATDAVLADVFGSALADAERQARACGCEAVDGELRVARHALRNPANEKLARVVEIIQRPCLIHGETAQGMIREIVEVVLERLERPPA